jgi:hypothetical protein
MSLVFSWLNLLPLVLPFIPKGNYFETSNRIGQFYRCYPVILENARVTARVTGVTPSKTVLIFEILKQFVALIVLLFFDVVDLKI